MVVKPAALQSGDVVGVIAPSEPISSGSLERTVRFLEKHGFKVKTGPNILKSVGDYTAGTAAERAEDINLLFFDTEIKAIIVAQGGMTASSVLDQIDFNVIKNNPKIFVGYSDATTLQLAVLSQTGLISFHGPNALSLPEFRPNGYTMSNFWKILTTKNSNLTIEPQSVWQEITSGAGEGIIFGGNLSCLCKLLGTKWDPIQSLDKIFGLDQKYLFFWEEVDDQFSEIVRDLWQVRNSGFFSKISAMIIGKLTSVAEKEYKEFPSKKSLFKEVTAGFDFPVIYGFDFGHNVPRATIPVGVKASIDTKKMKLEILEPAVI